MATRLSDDQQARADQMLLGWWTEAGLTNAQGAVVPGEVRSRAVELFGSHVVAAEGERDKAITKNDLVMTLLPASAVVGQKNHNDRTPEEQWAWQAAARVVWGEAEDKYDRPMQRLIAQRYPGHALMRYQSGGTADTWAAYITANPELWDTDLFGPILRAAAKAQSKAAKTAAMLANLNPDLAREWQDGITENAQMATDGALKDYRAALGASAQRVLRKGVPEEQAA